MPLVECLRQYQRAGSSLFYYLPFIVILYLQNRQTQIDARMCQRVSNVFVRYLLYVLHLLYLLYLLCTYCTYCTYLLYLLY